MSKLSLLGVLVIGVMSCSHPDAESNSITSQTLNQTLDSHNQTSDNQTPDSHNFTVLYGGTNVGSATFKQSGATSTIEYAVSNNGRGAKSSEVLTTTNKGVPIHWTVTGVTTFGNAVNESFSADDEIANWKAAAGTGSAPFDESAIYIAQNASPLALYVYAKALLDDAKMAAPALPSGTLRLKKLSDISLSSSNETVDASFYALSGISLDPDYLVVDENKQLVAIVAPRFNLIRNGLEKHDTRLREEVAALNAKRFEDIAKRVTHQYEQPLRINNVRIFDPRALQLSQPRSVLVSGQRIVSIDAVDVQDSQNEVVIDGGGGTLIPGLYEMHGHMSDNRALLNVLAGVTSVRDTGNEIDVLDPLIDKIEAETLIGPRITKSGFIEGPSEFSNATGELAESQEQALELVRDYARRGGYFQIKIYSSVKGEWVPAMAAEAHKLGLRVAGHVPAFSNADQMIAAGYDEITHINQLMLGWVLDLSEDTRTLYRIMGMKRFTDLDLSSDKVQKTLDAMVENQVAVDPTIVIHEVGLLARNGETRVGVRDYIDHMPIGVQRAAKSALLNVANAQEDAEYRAAFAKVIETLALMHQRGIFLVPGTDLGGAFEMHRELELFESVGMTPAEVLRRATYDMANYLGHGDELGSIEVGKLADFFLVPEDPLQDLKAIKTISMVLKGGTVYFPSEVYPEFGIEPFTKTPSVLKPKN